MRYLAETELDLVSGGQGLLSIGLLLTASRRPPSPPHKSQHPPPPRMLWHLWHSDPDFLQVA
jgi:hypothetical protein